MYGRLCWLALALLLLPHDSRAASVDLSGCPLTGLAADDNDIRLQDDPRPPGKPVTLPQVIADRVHAAVSKMVTDTLPELREGLTCDLLLSPVYRVGGFGQRDLFVAEIGIPTAGSYFLFYMYDTKTGAATENPPQVGSKWPQIEGVKDHLVRLPLVSSADLFGNGNRQVVFEERVHNGTEYNGVIYHYFDIGPQMELTHVLARETRVFPPDSSDNLYLRELTRVGTNKLRLDVYEASAKTVEDRRQLGYVILASGGPGTAFRVAGRHALPGFSSEELVSFCENSKYDDAFLRTGCDFYY